MKTQQIIFTLVLVVVVAAASFLGGMQYQKSKAPVMSGARGAASGQTRGNGQGRFGANGGATRGQVISVDANGITVKLSDGSSKIVLINGSTQIGKSQKASQSDIQTGDSVMAFGTANSDGSITAQNVQINPQGFERPSPSPAQ